MEPTSGHVHNPSLQPRNEQVVKYGEQRQEGVRSMPKEADLRSKIPARGQAFENPQQMEKSPGTGSTSESIVQHAYKVPFK